MLTLLLIVILIACFAPLMYVALAMGFAIVCAVCWAMMIAFNVVREFVLACYTLATRG